MTAFRDELANKIELLLPGPDQPHVAPIAIHRLVDIGVAPTTRAVLRVLEAQGRAQSITIPGRNGLSSRHYRRAPAL